MRTYNKCPARIFASSNSAFKRRKADAQKNIEEKEEEKYTSDDINILFDNDDERI